MVLDPMQMVWSGLVLVLGHVPSSWQVHGPSMEDVEQEGISIKDSFHSKPSITQLDKKSTLMEL